MHRHSERELSGAMLGRNAWDRSDLATTIGHDSVATDPSLSLWPAAR
jgi:hypothetical protein